MLRTTARGCTGVLVIAATVQMAIVPVHAAPESIFGSAPEMPDAEPVRAGDVEGKSGDYTHSIPIEVPPGRLKAVPGLSLRYSSSAPVYGSSVGQGWTLAGFPTIRLDTHSGELGRDAAWVSDLAGGARLIEVAGQIASDVSATFYAENDSTFARYERLNSLSPYEWRVRRPLEGDVVYFGKRVRSLDPREPSSKTHLVAPIARMQDAFGNRVDYEYTWAEMATLSWRSGSDVAPAPKALYYVPTAIHYGANDNAGLDHHARIEFHYDRDSDMPTRCDGFGVTIGSAISYRTGTLMASGVQTLSRIDTFTIDETSARPSAGGGFRKVRSYALEHDAELASCDADHAPRRVLQSLTETGWAPDGTETTRPATRFDYGSLRGNGWRLGSLETDKLDAGFERATWRYLVYWEYPLGSTGYDSRVESMTVDMNGDGILDLLELGPQPAGANNRCVASWSEGTGSGFVSRGSFELPTMRWKTSARGEWEACSLDGQRSLYQPRLDAGEKDECRSSRNNDLDPLRKPHDYPSYLNYQWADINHDGAIDLVAHYYRNPARISTRERPFLNFSSAPSAQRDRTSSTSRDWAEKVYDVFIEEGAGIDSCGVRPDRDGGGTGFVWHIFFNDGTGRLDDEPETRVQPFPAAVPPLRTFEPRPIGFIDYNGDGYEDAGYHLGAMFDGNPGRRMLEIMLGDVDGYFHADGASPYRAADTTQSVTRKTFFFCAGCGADVDCGSGIRPDMCPTSCPQGGSLVCGGQEQENQFLSGVVPAVEGDPGFYATVSFPDVGWESRNVEARIDLNADGLPDWVSDGTARLNDGRGLEGISLASTPTDGARDLFPYPNIDESWRSRGAGGRQSRIKSTTDGYADEQDLEYGRSYEDKVWFDFDGDGLLDLVSVQYDGNRLWDAPGSWPSEALVALNLGGVGFLPPRRLNDSEMAFAIAGVTEYRDVRVRRSREGYARDFDGDGITDYVYPDTDGELLIKKLNYGDAPPGLLTHITHWNGGLTRIRYGSTNDSDVVSTDPSRGRVMRKPKFVVESITQSESFRGPLRILTPLPGGSPFAVQKYHYTNPVWARDSRDEDEFRGFEQVAVTSPLGAVTVETFTYDRDVRGLPEDTITFESRAHWEADQPHSITHQSWDSRLADGRAQELTTHQLRATRVWECQQSESAADCRARSPRKTNTIFYGVPRVEGTDAFGDLVWIPRSERTMLGNLLFGVRETTRDNLLYEPRTAYRLVTEEVEHKEYTTSWRWERRGLTTTEYDDSYRVALKVSEQVDEQGKVATTAHTYDMETGLPTRRIKPVQYAKCAPSGCGAPQAETYRYDETKRFAQYTTNELGHEVEVVHDAGTGTPVATFGPNSVANSFGFPVRESTRTGIDGLGRVTAEWVTVSDDLMGYRLAQTKQVTYDDDIGTGSRTTTTTFSEDNVEAEQVETLHDVTGRVRRTLTTVADPERGDYTVERRFDYDPAGNMNYAHVPDASQMATTGELVTYAFTFDTLGRQRTLRRPDGTGTDIRYEYPGTTVREDFAPNPAEEEPLARTTLKFDALDQLVEVRERTDDAEAVTTYQYDGRGNLRRIQDADGMVVTLEHDYLGGRTAVERAGRRWTYGYDLNANMTTVTSPHPASQPAALYTASTTYDALDRPLSQLAGTRTLSSTWKGRLQADEMAVYEYDLNAHGVGRLSSVKWGKLGFKKQTTSPTLSLMGSTNLSTSSFWPTIPPVVPTWTQTRALSLNYDGLGRVVEETRSFDLNPAGYEFADERTVRRRYDLLGRMTSVTYPDGPSMGTSTTVTTVYDGSSKPVQLTWEPPNGSETEIGSVYHNQAGFPMTMNTGPVRRVFTRDRLGRVTTDQVLAGGSRFLRERRTYFAAGDTKTLASERRGSPTHSFIFGYDDQHQLKTAQDDQGYSATFSYSPHGRVWSAQVEAPASAPSAYPRNVTYDYSGDSDPEAVDVLVEPSGAAYAAYDYTDSGAIAQRQTSEGTWQFMYDGHDRQRRVVHPDDRSELYYYGLGGARWLALEFGSDGAPSRLRWWFEETEIRYDGNGFEDKTWVNISAGSPIARIENRSTIEYPIHNEFGHLLAVADDDGEVTTTFVYGPFGEVLAQSGAVDDHLNRFNGKTFDATSGLSYYGHRYYDAQALIWTRTDPRYRIAPDFEKSEPRRMGLYTFSLNNPMKFVDPDGQDVLLVLGTNMEQHAFVDTTIDPTPESQVAARLRYQNAVIEALRTNGHIAENERNIRVLHAGVDFANEAQLVDIIATMPEDTFIYAGHGAPEGLAVFGQGSQGIRHRLLAETFGRSENLESAVLAACYSGAYVGEVAARSWRTVTGVQDLYEMEPRWNDRRDIYETKTRKDGSTYEAKRKKRPSADHMIFRDELNRSQRPAWLRAEPPSLLLPTVGTSGGVGP